MAIGLRASNCKGRFTIENAIRWFKNHPTHSYAQTVAAALLICGELTPEKCEVLLQQCMDTVWQHEGVEMTQAFRHAHSCLSPASPLLKEIEAYQANIK